MIANISPSILTLDETLNTLKYANRAKNIKINLKKNVIETEYHISKYDEVITALRDEIEVIKGQLAKKSDTSPSGDTSFIISNNENVDRIEKVQKDITNHFQEEIKMRKDIIEIERKSEAYKIESAEKEYELYKNLNTKDSEQIRKFISNVNNEIEKKSVIVNEKYSQQAGLINKRLALQKTITQITKENSSGGKILMHTYQYYSAILDNITLEHRRHVNFGEIKRKDFQINKVVDQIKARDDFIINANNEIRKKKIAFKYNNDNLKSIEEVEMEPMRLPVIVNNNLKQNNFINDNRTRNNKISTPTHSK